MWPQITQLGSVGIRIQGAPSWVSDALAAPLSPTQGEPGSGGAGGWGGLRPSLTLEVDPRADLQHTREGGGVQRANEVLQRRGLHGPRGSLDAD